MKSQKGEKIHPIMIDSPPSSFRSSSSKASDTIAKSWQNFKKGAGKSGYASPPLPPPSIYGRPRRQSTSSVGYCLALLCSVLVFFVILMGAAFLILFVVLQPKMPVYNIQNVRISSLNVTSRAGNPVQNATKLLHNPVLNTDIAFTIKAQNPNGRIGLHYKEVSVYVSYQGTDFAQSHIAPFYQGHNTTTDVVADMKATNAPLSDSAGQSLQAAIDKNDVPLFARINVKGAVQIGSWTLPSVTVHVWCDVRASPPTAPQGANLLSKSCYWKR